MNTITLFFLFLCPLCFAVNNIALRAFQTQIADDVSSLSFFQASFCFWAAVLYAFGIQTVPSLSTVLLAVGFGCCFFICSTCGARCYLVGAMSLTSVLVNTSMLLPIFFSIIFYDDVLSLRMVIGIVLVLATFVLSSLRGRASPKQFHKIWLLLVAVAFMSNGLTAILQKIRQQTEPNSNLFVFPAIGYLTAAFLFLLMHQFQRKKQPFFPAADLHRPFWWVLVLLAGLGTFAGNCLLQFLCTRVSAGSLYPTVNGGLCVLTATASFLLFRERLSVYKLCAIVVGLLGIIVLSV